MSAMNIKVTHEAGITRRQEVQVHEVEVTCGVVLSAIHVQEPEGRMLNVIVNHVEVHIPWTRILKVEDLSRA